MLQKLKNTIKEIGMMSVGLTLAFIIFIGLSISNAAWTEPTDMPPAGNLSAPLNISLNPQIKEGALQVNGLRNLGNTILDGTLTMPMGAGAGKVLTSDASGNVTLQAPKIATYNDLPKGALAGSCAQVYSSSPGSYSTTCSSAVAPAYCLTASFCACEAGFARLGTGRPGASGASGFTDAFVCRKN